MVRLCWVKFLVPGRPTNLVNIRSGPTGWGLFGHLSFV